MPKDKKDYWREKNPVPNSDRKGCLCKDSNTYSKKCCDGSYWSQGIGNI